MQEHVFPPSSHVHPVHTPGFSRCPGRRLPGQQPCRHYPPGGPPCCLPVSAAGVVSPPQTGGCPVNAVTQEHAGLGDTVGSAWPGRSVSGEARLLPRESRWDPLVRSREAPWSMCPPCPRLATGCAPNLAPYRKPHYKASFAGFLFHKMLRCFHKLCCFSNSSSVQMCQRFQFAVWARRTLGFQSSPGTRAGLAPSVLPAGKISPGLAAGRSALLSSLSCCLRRPHVCREAFAPR